eukprot:gene7005-8352_t
MCSYNAVNGVPACASKFLGDVLRNEWGFKGYLTSDSGAIEDIYEHHHYVANAEEAACAAIRDGRTDIDSGAVYHDALLSAVKHGICEMKDIDDALKRTLALRFELGLFDNASSPYWSVDPDNIGNKDSRDLNLLGALESMVLLTNGAQVLPLRMGSALAVIGPHAKARSALVGNYLGQICANDNLDCIETPLQAVVKLNVGGKVVYAPGCSSLTKNDTTGFDDAVAAAKESDAVILFLGIDGEIEGENNDRTSIDLPQIQHELAAKVIEVGRPTVIVLINGGMVAVAEEMKTKAAILESFYPGHLGAKAIASTIFGKNSHCCGKLPVTIYPKEYIQDIKMTEMELDFASGRTYRYYTGKPLFQFGHGLSLTTFNFSGHGVSRTIERHRRLVESLDLLQCLRTCKAHGTATCGNNVTYSVEVTNTGTRTGDEVVMAYMYPNQIKSVQFESSKLIKQLFGFERVHLTLGESRTVSFQASIKTFYLTDRITGDVMSVPGTYSVVLTNEIYALGAGAVRGPVGDTELVVDELAYGYALDTGTQMQQHKGDTAVELSAISGRLEASMADADGLSVTRIALDGNTD